MWKSKVLESSIWESKAWIALERIIGLIGLLVLLFGIWNTLLKNESKQAERDKKINATLEAIEQRIGNDEAWRRLKQPLEKNLLESKSRQQ